MITASNAVFNFSIGRLENEVNALVDRVSENEEAFHNVRTASKKTKMLQAAYEKQHLYGQEIIALFNSLVPGAELVSFSFTDEKNTISVMTNEPVRVALVVNRMLESETVAQIVITAARRDAEGVYRIDMEVELE